MKNTILIIGKLYFFDSRFTSYGELIKIDHKGHTFFKSIFNDNENYHEENGLIEFATQFGFFPYEEGKFNQDYKNNQRKADEIVNFTDNF